MYKDKELDDERWPFNDPRREPSLFQKRKEMTSHHLIDVATERPEGALTHTEFLMLYAQGHTVFWNDDRMFPLQVLSLYRYIPGREGYQDIPSTMGHAFPSTLERLKTEDPSAFFTARRWYDASFNSIQIISYRDQNILDGDLNGYNSHFVYAHPRTELQRIAYERIKDQLA